MFKIFYPLILDASVTTHNKLEMIRIL